MYPLGFRLTEVLGTDVVGEQLAVDAGLPHAAGDQLAVLGAEVEFGVRGVGYNVRELRQYIIEILGLDSERRLAIVGAGNLGYALCHYSGFSKGNFLVVAVLDSDPSRIGDATPAGQLVEDAERLAEIVVQRRVEIGVITTPAAAAQAVCDQMVQAGLRAILNFAPTRVMAPDHVLAKTVDLKVHLEELSFFLAHAEN
jgi:redox-sensing transcriptional repressor